MSVQVSLVPPEAVVRLWPKVRPFMVKSGEYTYGRFEAEDILNTILDGNQLWIAFDGEDVIAAVVTSIDQYPRKKCLTMHFSGGEEHKHELWVQPLLKLLQHWAYETGCECIECAGRPGWAKMFQHNGHKVVWHTFELPVADCGLEEANG